MHQKLTLAFACACALVVALLGATTLHAETTPEPDPPQRRRRPTTRRTRRRRPHRRGTGAPAARAPADDRPLPPRDLALAAHDGSVCHPQAPERAGRLAGKSRPGGRRRADAEARAEPAAQAPVALHPPLRRGVERSERTLLRWSADGLVVPARVRAGICFRRKERPTAGRRSSRCGSPNAHTGPAAGSTHGRTRRAAAG